MEFEFDIPEQVFDIAVAVAVIATIGYLLWPPSAATRRKQAENWARRNLVPPDPEVLAAAEAAFARRRRPITIASILLIAASTLAIVLSGGMERAQWAPWLAGIALGIIAAMVTVWEFRSPWLSPGTSRIAHVRPVTVSDYVPTVTRWGGWLAGGLCALGLVIAPPTLATLMSALPAATAVVAAIVSEWAARTVTRAPQPASNRLQLYAQDIWRGESATYCYQGLTLAGGMALQFLSHSSGLSRALRDGILFAGLGLTVLAIIGYLQLLDGRNWTRRRLWPSLRPGEWVSAT